MRGGAGFCRTCFFNSRPQNRARRGGFGRCGAARRFLAAARRGGGLRNLSAALSLRSVRRRVLCRTLHRVLRRSFCVPDFAPDFYAGRAPELLIFL